MKMHCKLKVYFEEQLALGGWGEKIYLREYLFKGLFVFTSCHDEVFSFNTKSFINVVLH